SLTLSIPEVNAFQVGGIIALFERAVGYYAILVNINAYHQPGVEAGKKAAGVFLKLLGNVRSQIENSGRATADEIANAIGADPEDTYHCLKHLAANDSRITVTLGTSPTSDQFHWKA
ncbi:MAG: glucose-6-phosphate isomerase, partial [Roseimicrobium sp.]